jgi:sugar lactone lactonase YvrE
MMRTNRLVVLLAIAIGFMAGCASQVSRDVFDTELARWPAHPETKRIIYVGEFSNSTDMGIRPGLWRSLTKIIAGRRDEGMIRPMAVATNDSRKLIYVADPGAGCVHRYDLHRSSYKCMTAGPDSTMLSPVGLALTGDGHLFVADSRQGKILHGVPGSSRLIPFDVEVELSQPTGLHWEDSSGRLFVTDTGKQSVLVLDRDGRKIGLIGRRGSLSGEFNFPTYLWVDASGDLVVADTLNFRVQRFDGGGDFVSAFGTNGDSPGDFARPKGVATDHLGNVYVVDALFHAMQVFDARGSLLLSIGQRGHGAGEFWLPNGIFITRDNTIFVADSYNKRVQVFRYVGPSS